MSTGKNRMIDCANSDEGPCFHDPLEELLQADRFETILDELDPPPVMYEGKSASE